MSTVKSDFQKNLKKYPINTRYLIVKPNRVSNEEGEFTEAEILDWFFESFPKQEKIVVESYTPWRGLRFVEHDTHESEGVSLEGGKRYWEFYIKQDEYFFEKKRNR